ncbi:MAG: biotin transporter BioY [Clostridia bacterium]|nr:biotin transporter BioY [Clostridia bacterium]
MKTKDLVYMAFFVSLATAGAFLKLPLPFMSVTFQLFFAILAGIILGPVRGLIAMTVYMIIGLAGLPIFTLGGGPAYVLQPSFGFILGFLPAAFFSGLVYGNSSPDNKYAVYPAYITGIITAYAIGIPYLFLILKFFLNNPDTTLISVAASMLIYIAKDAVLGLVLFLFAGHIPMLRKFAKS